MPKKRTIYSILSKNLDATRYLTVGEISKKTGYSKSAVRGAGHRISGFIPMTTKHPWNLVDWRLANVDISNTWDLPYIQVAMFRLRNSTITGRPLFDMRKPVSSLKSNGRSLLKGILKRQAIDAAKFKKSRAAALRKGMK